MSSRLDLQYTVPNSTRLRHKSDKRMAKIITKVGEIFHKDDEPHPPPLMEFYNDIQLQAISSCKLKRR